MRDSLRRFKPCILTVLALLLAVGLAPASAAESTCDANKTWVLNPSLPNFNADLEACGFYQYSWQSFLYLVSPVPGKDGALNFETYTSVGDVFPESSKLQAAANKTLGPITLFQDKRLNKQRRFQVRGSEPLKAVEQAGSKGILVDQNKNVTYYEEYLDPIAVSFIKACDLTIKACQTAPFAADLRFPPGAIEIKISWRVIPAGLPHADTYYTLKGVEVYNPQANNGKGANQTVDLGLAGVHLVYTTKTHKEMVWATFEHIDNAPDGPCTPAARMVPPEGFSGWAFNNALPTDCDKVNKWVKGTLAPYPVTQAVRNYAYGSDASSKGQTNATFIRDLNHSVLDVLPAGSVWKNYFLVGAVWVKGGALPAIAPGPTSNELGSTFLANATMETFTQFHNGPTGNGTDTANCFNCHNAKSPSTDPPNQPAFMVSHAFRNGSTTPTTCPIKTLPPACNNTQPGAKPVAAHATKATAKPAAQKK